jgi:hypothetical protein
MTHAVKKVVIITKCELTVEKKDNATVETRCYFEKRGKKFVPTGIMYVYNLNIRKITKKRKK